MIYNGLSPLALPGGILSPGLSPLARGTLAWEVARRAILRFIPAGAGNTFAGQSH